MRAVPLFALLHVLASCERCSTPASKPDSGLVENAIPDGSLDPDPDWRRLAGTWHFPSPESEGYRRRYEELLPDSSAGSLQMSSLLLSMETSRYDLTLTGDTLELRLAKEVIERKRYIVIEADRHHLVIRAWMEQAPGAKEVIEFTILENWDITSPQFRARFGVERLVALLYR